MPVSTIGVVGAGVMGAGIAQVAATKGLNVVLVDVSDDALKKGIEAIDGRLARLVEKGKITPAEKTTALGRIKGATSYEYFKPAEAVIEAATEDFGLKVKILKQLDRLVGAETL